MSLGMRAPASIPGTTGSPEHHLRQPLSTELGEAFGHFPVWQQTDGQTDRQAGRERVQKYIRILGKNQTSRYF